MILEADGAFRLVTIVECDGNDGFRDTSLAFLVNEVLHCL
jgi:hypothetical protein